MLLLLPVQRLRLIARRLGAAAAAGDQDDAVVDDRGPTTAELTASHGLAAPTTPTPSVSVV